MKKIIFFGLLFLLSIIFCISFFYVRSQIYFSHGEQKKNVNFEIAKGESVIQIGKDLSMKGIVDNYLVFCIYMEISRKSNSIYPGEYPISGNMTIPEISVVITNQKKAYEKVLFKEGWTAKQMADELAVHGYSKKEFLDMVNDPPQELVSEFSVLADRPQSGSLEGYLFPDTYYFSKDETISGIMEKILSNTQNKIGDVAINEIKKQNKSVFNVLTLASIVEREMADSTEAKLIAGVFQNRLAGNMLLQSDATLTYVLGDKIDQHSSKDLELDSPYNTYKYKGLPPGPISNPGADAILAAINPKKSDYHFFLTVAEGGTKKTVFSTTFEEHVANRAKYGL